MGVIVVVCHGVCLWCDNDGGVCMAISWWCLQDNTTYAHPYTHLSLRPSAPNKKALYKHMGYKKETLTAGGPLAGMMHEHRSMTPEQASVFRAAAHATYDAFVTKAAASRGMTTDQLLAAAEGRVWSGRAAVQMGLVDALGGMHRACALARHAAGLGDATPVRIVEMGGGWAPWVVQLINGLRAVVAMGSVAGVVMEPLVETVGVALMAQQSGGGVLALMDMPVVG